MSNSTQKQGRTERRTQKNKAPKQISIFTILLILIVIGIFVGIYFGIRYCTITLKYKYYTDKMVDYGYNKLYDNDKATAPQKVSNAEAIKVVMGSIMNKTEILDVYGLADTNAYDGTNWYNYSVDIGINTVITSNELKLAANKVDAVMLAVKTLESFHNISVDETKLEMSTELLKEYTSDEQRLLAKAVTIGIIENNDSALDDSLLIKGELNKLVIHIVEKYSTIYYGNSAGNVRVNVITDKEKLPTNYEEYPYVVDNIEKDIYELDYIVESSYAFRNPKDTYKIMGYLYGQTNDLIVRYFNKILNIDYETITEANFLQKIDKDVAYKLTEQDVQEYVQYVKDNKIKLRGSAKPLLPIMYGTGERYVIRTEIKFTVLNSETQYNLLFGDEDNKVKYNSSEITMYVDVPTGMTLNSNSLLIYVDCLSENLIKPTQLVVMEE